LLVAWWGLPSGPPQDFEEADFKDTNA
jgi:hypothetical protein